MLNMRALAVLAIATTLSSGTFADYELTLFGTMDRENSACYFVSDDGVVLGSAWTHFYGLPPFSYAGFVAKGSQQTQLMPLPGHQTTYAVSVNRHGIIVGGSSAGGSQAPITAAMWNMQGHATPITPMPAQPSYGQTIDEDGTIMVQLDYYKNRRAVLWSSGRYRWIAPQLSMLTVTDRNVYGVIAGYLGETYHDPVVIRGTEVQFLQGYQVSAQAFGINKSDVVVGRADERPIKWTRNSYSFLPRRHWTKGFANAINDSGAAVGLLYEEYGPV